MSLEVIHSLAPERAESRSASRTTSRLEARPKTSDSSPSDAVRNRPSSSIGADSRTAGDSSTSGKLLDSQAKFKPRSASDSTADKTGRKMADAAAADVPQSPATSLAAAKKTHAAFGSSAGLHDRNSIAAVACREKEATQRSSMAGPAHASKSALSMSKGGGSPRLTAAKRQTTFQFEDLSEGEEDVQSTRRSGVLLSQASLTHKVMQELEFTGSHQANNHLFLEVQRSLLLLFMCCLACAVPHVLFLM